MVKNLGYAKVGYKDEDKVKTLRGYVVERDDGTIEVDTGNGVALIRKEMFLFVRPIFNKNIDG